MRNNPSYWVKKKSVNVTFLLVSYVFYEPVKFRTGFPSLGILKMLLKY